MIDDNNYVTPGDLIFYNFDNKNEPPTYEFEHVAILVEKNGSDPKQWKVVHSNGSVEVFEWGARRTRLGTFGLKSNGGDYNNWNPLWNNWTFKIYGVPTN